VLVFFGATLMVVLAEMGDKTQLLAMAMATRFRAREVLWGVFTATLLNHALAVAFGTYLRSSLDLEFVKMVAAGSFILFGLWTIRGDTYDDEKEKKARFGPVFTVALAFFFAEMGDKTQLATVALAAKYNAPIETLLGTTAGMLIADAIGIYIGVVAGRKLPERLIKWMSALIFLVFGFMGLYTTVPEEYLRLPYGIAAVGGTALTIAILVWKNRKAGSGKQHFPRSGEARTEIRSRKLP
jgi:putative Ca2+/H+ antiporter (TMEM165/GDT1 family)